MRDSPDLQQAAGDGAPLIPPQALVGLEGWEAAVVWGHGSPVVTWRLSAAHGVVRYLKVARLGCEISLRAEWERLVWAAAYLPVPRVLDYGTAGEHEWLLTVGLEGISAVDESVLADPSRAVPLLARALRRFHAVPVEQCPFDSSTEALLRHVERRVAAGLVDPAREFQPEHQGMTAAEALARALRLRPPAEDGEHLVVCHGDYCPPNVLVHDGQVAGYVDLGGLGMGDRWWDLAVATWSVTWNFGPGWEPLFLAEYGVVLDARRTALFRLLHDLLP